MHIRFQAMEYTAQGGFQRAEYAYVGEETSGWEITRNDAPHLALGQGYRLLQTRLCGICGTDIDRRYYPYPLPQIIGHEVVTQGMDGEGRFAVEINDTPYYRSERGDYFGDAGLPTHTPGRMVLGIDRLPGGFGPYILAPHGAIISVDELADDEAVLIEPLAAALQAVIAAPPARGSRVAVLGPRRLGTLLVAALHAYRGVSGNSFSIHALARRRDLLDVCLKLGADTGIDLTQNALNQERDRFDVVYDTTGTLSGFEQALNFTHREIHLKSTNGQPMGGLNKMTALVVDELALLPYTPENLGFHWPQEDRGNQTIYCAPGVRDVPATGHALYRGDIATAEGILSGSDFTGRLPRFDLAIASSLAEIDAIIRPSRSHENSLVRPRGAILFKGDPGSSPLLNFLARGGRLRSSRCGNFETTLEIMRPQKKVMEALTHHLISHCFPVREIETAFSYAQDKRAYKVIVKHP